MATTNPHHEKQSERSYRFGMGVGYVSSSATVDRARDTGPFLLLADSSRVCMSWDQWRDIVEEDEASGQRAALITVDQRDGNNKSTSRETE